MVKRCSKCQCEKELNADNFRPRPEQKIGWSAACRECLRSDRLDYHARGREEDATRRAAEDAIRPLIRAYEAIRVIPCAARTGLENRLGLALSRYGSALSCDGRVYRWVREEQSISRLRGV